MSDSVKFSIITPSFRSSTWLKLCIASVADQEGVDVEHIVQDAGSDDGTLDWLLQNRRVKTHVEKDHGMYDAINHGFKRSQGEILAYLNCDEQYLPGALKNVHDLFRQYPETDVCFADTIVVDTNGDYICHRKSLLPLKHHLWLRFPILSCAIFVRRKILDQEKIYFDAKWRDLGDLFWVMDMVKRGVSMRLLRCFTSVFTVTGVNMNFSPNAVREKAVKVNMTPPWIRKISPAIILHHKLRMLASGTYFQRPFDYALYTVQSPEKRITKNVTKPTGIWHYTPKTDAAKALK